jgi:hypothetical protein
MIIIRVNFGKYEVSKKRNEISYIGISVGIVSAAGGKGILCTHVPCR